MLDDDDAIDMNLCAELIFVWWLRTNSPFQKFNRIPTVKAFPIQRNCNQIPSGVISDFTKFNENISINFHYFIQASIEEQNYCLQIGLWQSNLSYKEKTGAILSDQFYDKTSFILLIPHWKINFE